MQRRGTGSRIQHPDSSRSQAACSGQHRPRQESHQLHLHGDRQLAVLTWDGPSPHAVTKENWASDGHLEPSQLSDSTSYT